jgi:hypothetical protein
MQWEEIEKIAKMLGSEDVEMHNLAQTWFCSEKRPPMNLWWIMNRLTRKQKGRAHKAIKNMLKCITDD